MAEQLTLDLPHRPAFEQQDFLVAGPNEQAVALVDAWPDWPSHALALVGPAGCGKSHLARVWQARSLAREVDPLAIDLDVEDAQTCPAVLIEDADRGMDETGLFHLYNLVKEMRGHLLLTAQDPPARWRVALPDLKSRLATVPVAPMGPPDDRLLQAVLLKQFHDRQLKVPMDLLTYLASHMERSFAAARTLVAELDKVALARKRPVTKALARDVLNRLGDAP